VFVFARRPENENRLRRERFLKRQKYVQIGAALLSSIPNVLRWSIQLSIFVVLMVPLFNEVAVGLGSSTQFDTSVQQGKHFHVSKALATMKELLFGGGR
jgi:hypothetical protein